MRLRVAARLFFILYCIEAGTLLLLAPWSAGWERMVMELPVAGLRDLCLQPWLRAGLSGFGLVHLIWGAHDLELMLAGRRRRV